MPPAWLRIETPATVEYLDRLDLGEASAISLAQEIQAALMLIDERAGTSAARGVGIQVVGTLGVLIEAAVERLIDFEPTLERLLLETSFYASPSLITSARQIMRERSRAGKRLQPGRYLK